MRFEAMPARAMPAGISIDRYIYMSTGENRSLLSIVLLSIVQPVEGGLKWRQPTSSTAYYSVPTGCPYRPECPGVHAAAEFMNSCMIVDVQGCRLDPVDSFSRLCS